MDDLNGENGETDEHPEVLFLEGEEGTSLNGEEINEIEEQSIKDDSIMRIEAHEKDVFCLSLSKNGRWLASGSEDDTAAVWDVTQKPIRQHYHIVGKHVDSVHCVAWNCSSDLLASGDMSGRIVCTHVRDSIDNEPATLIIEDCQSTEQQMPEEEEQENSFEHIRWLLWHPSANGILFAGSGDDAVAKIWDFKTGTCISEVNLPGTCTGAMDLHLSGTVAAFGCSNGLTALVTINLSDQKLKLVHIFTSTKKEEISENLNNQEEKEENKNSVECINFVPGNFPWLAVGMANGQLTIFNWEHPAGRYEFNNDGEAVVDCIWRICIVDSITSISLISICVDGIIRIWDAKNGQLLKKIGGGGDQIYSAIKFKNDEEVEGLLTGSEGGLIRIFELS
uniref:WD_REPEATS_REGION domain-containing protein n=1 Tax=Meloidogyne hapla TaxID=6305 RepID=A0A1I8C005_MELHA